VLLFGENRLILASIVLSQYIFHRRQTTYYDDIWTLQWNCNVRLKIRLNGRSSRVEIDSQMDVYSTVSKEKRRWCTIRQDQLITSESNRLLSPESRAVCFADSMPSRTQASASSSTLMYTRYTAAKLCVIILLYGTVIFYFGNLTELILDVF